jgi:hypothetical protein
VKYVPAWVPGAGFQKIAARSRKLNEEFLNGPYDLVKEEMVKSHLNLTGFALE